MGEVIHINASKEAEISTGMIHLNRLGYNIFNLPSALHEWTYQNATIVGTTMTVIDTGSVGGLNLTNIDAASLPTLNSDSIEFFTGDSLKYSVGDFRIGDSTGVFHCYMKIAHNASNVFPFGSVDEALSNDQFFLQRRSDNTLQLLIRIGGTFYTTRTTDTLDASYHLVSWSQGGGRSNIWIDGVKLSINGGVDSVGTRWLNSVPNRDNITMSPTDGNIKGVFYCPYVNDATITGEANEILSGSL